MMTVTNGPYPGTLTNGRKMPSGTNSPAADIFILIISIKFIYQKQRIMPEELIM